MTYHLLVHYEDHEEAYCVDTFLLRGVWIENGLQLEEWKEHSNVKTNSCMVNGFQIHGVGVYAESQDS